MKQHLAEAGALVTLLFLGACKPVMDEAAITSTRAVPVEIRSAAPTAAQPTQVPLPVKAPSPVVEIAGNGLSTLALLKDGSVWFLSTPRPGPVAGLTDMVALANGGWDFAVALKSDGTVWTWGENNYGQLGDGTITDRDAGQVEGLPPIVAVSAGSGHSLALTEGGEVWMWGDNSYGQLGGGPDVKTISTVPIKVIGLGDVTMIRGCGQNSIALRKDGTLWAWGFNTAELSGEADTNGLYSNVPVQIKGIDHVTDFACGSHILAVRSDGSLWAWGGNHSSQLGFSTYGDSVSTPTLVEGLTGIADVAANSQSSYVLKQDGTVWSWGSNVYFELGYVTPHTVQEAPAMMPGISDAVAVAADAEHAALLKEDGTVWLWGHDFLFENVAGDPWNATGPLCVLGP